MARRLRGSGAGAAGAVGAPLDRARAGARRALHVETVVARRHGWCGQPLWIEESMMFLRRSVSQVLKDLAVSYACVVVASSPAAAQSPAPPPDTPTQAPAVESPASAPGPNAGRLSFTVGVDFATAYVFRGIFQEDAGAIVWPAVDMGVTLAEGDGAVRKVAVNLGLWNSLHSGPSGSDGPSDKVWYESDFYASLTFGLGGGVSVMPFYTAYTSPNGTFGTVTEFAVKVSVADAEALGRFALSPYALVAFELDGGADGGERSGRYLELGIAPGLPLADGKVSLAFPVKLGWSLADYYEGPSEEDTFGYLDTGITASVPFGFVPRSYGSWTLRGGLSLVTLGENPKALNRGEGTKVVGQFGVGLAY